MSYPTITYGNHTVDYSKAPASTIAAILQRGTAHFLGNEQAAKVSGAKAKAEKDGKPMTDPEIETLKDELVAEALADLYAGEIGSGRGPRLDPVEREFNKLVDDHIANTLAGANIKFPKNRRLPTEDETVSFANGVTRTLAEMRANVNTNHGERLRKDAEKRVNDQKKKAEKAKADAELQAKNGPVAAEALGL